MYLFNPDNDLALANFSPNYTPPASAARIAEELAVLPVWYAGCDGASPLGEQFEGDELIIPSDCCDRAFSRREGEVFGPVDLKAERRDVKGGAYSMINGTGRKPVEVTKVIADGEINRSFLNAVKEIFPLYVELIPLSDVALYPCSEIIPWGWNPALKRKLLSNGVAAETLPSQKVLTCLRDYSNRRHAVEVLRELQPEMDGFCGESHFFTEAGELFRYLQSTPGNKVLKMPLSGSGKGLIWILGGITDKQRDWCRRVIREQGGVVAEPVLAKVQDFAMEFLLHNGQARFAGYSIFTAAASGAYMGNALLSNKRIEEKLSEYAPIDLLHRLRSALEKKLQRRFPFYSGYAGVDMMVCETCRGYGIHPCVEINMRMNMGVVARIFHERFMPPDAEGMFVVDYFKEPEGALSFHQKMQQESPLVAEKGKIVSGYLALTPVTKSTRYIAYSKIV